MTLSEPTIMPYPIEEWLAMDWREFLESENLDEDEIVTLIRSDEERAENLAAEENESV